MEKLWVLNKNTCMGGTVEKLWVLNKTLAWGVRWSNYGSLITFQKALEKRTKTSSLTDPPPRLRVLLELL